MMPRPFSEPYEPEDIFDRAEAQERRARIEASRAEREVTAQLEARQDAERRESARLFTLRSNEMLIAREYRTAGVEPLAVNERGVPTVSLAMLRWQGWTIEQVGDRNVLIAPPGRSNPARRMQDYDDQGS